MADDAASRVQRLLPEHERPGPPVLAPPHWVRVQTVVCESGWPAVVALAGDLADPARLAVAEAHELREAGVDVRPDGSGYPCVDPGDPQVAEWAAGLDEAVTEASAVIDAALEVAIHG